MKINNRLNNISEYHFHKLDLLKKEYISSGKTLLDLSIGDPDLPVDNKIITALIDGLNIKDYNKYPPYDGILDLKRAIIKYYEEVFSVSLSLDEVLILIGSKEGINNIIPAVCGIGDYAIIPKPSYPVYEACCHLWGVNTIKLDLYEKDKYLPEVENLSKKIPDKTKLLILNYPNNPTGAVANEEFFKYILDFCSANEIILYNDGAYNEILEPGKEPLSLLQVDKDKKSIEFGTFSKIYNMTGFRIGYVVGNSEIIKSLLKIKSNVDSGQFIPIQYAAIEALKLNREYVNTIRSTYFERKQAVYNMLDKHNIAYFKGEGTFYIWCKTPKGYSTEGFCGELINNNGIVVTPGIAFGDPNNENFRISLTKEKNQIIDAFSKLRNYE